MCTVTFVPKGEHDFILTSNRDENAARSPQNLTSELKRGSELIFPRDTEAGGTWIAVSDSNRLVCVLNGAFIRHDRKPPYRRSRGLMALDFFNFPNAAAFFDRYAFHGMEAFTMVIYDNGQLYDFRWDEKRSYLKALDTQQLHIWSSATLYEPEVKIKREQWFAEWQQQNETYDLPTIMDFHQNAGEGDPWNDVIMNRGGIVQTVSITNIIKKGSKVEMQYHDLLNQHKKSGSLLLKTQKVGLR